MTDGAQMQTRREALIAAGTLAMIAAHLALRFGTREISSAAANAPLFAAYLFGGIPLLEELLLKLMRREFGSDLLAGLSIVTSLVLGEYLAGALVILMLSGGEALEAYAVRSASSVLEALASRLPSVAHRRSDGTLKDVSLDENAVGDVLVVLPHEFCPVDGTVIKGHSVMDESYLTGEPYMMSKTPGAGVLSGAINGEAALTIRADKLAVDSRYAQIMSVMRQSEQHRPKLRRLGDQLGAFYTPVAVTIALAAWFLSGEAIRFLAVLVVATPCPLLIAIPVSIIGSISLAAKRGIIVRNPIALEKIDTCRTIIFDKTGTLTYGEPRLTEQLCAPGLDPSEVLSLAGSLERYSKHPLASAVVGAARAQNAVLREASEISERLGEGLGGVVAGKSLRIISRKQLLKEQPGLEKTELPEQVGGMECLLLIDGAYAATYRFRDAPRSEGTPFVNHLGRKHHFEKIMLVSGDRDSEVRYLAALVGIEDVHADQSPEEKVAIATAESARANTVFVGDGIIDAPALMVSTVGIALGSNSDVTTEAADVVIMDNSLQKVDEFMHISRRMRRIALQSAVGGMALSVVGMGLAALGYLPPVAGAIAQEIIDVLAVLNALRVAIPPKTLTDY